MSYPDQIVTHHRTCKCGHDMSSHHSEISSVLTFTASRPIGTKFRGSCLCRGCECREFGESATR